MADAKYTPKQVRPLTAAEWDEFSAGQTLAIARQLIKLLPPLTATSRVHDDGCATGDVTEAIMDTNPPKGIEITGTDISPFNLEGYSARIASKGWPAKAILMDSTKSTLPDNTFTHSIGNITFAVFTREAAAEMTGHVYRTLQPGGVVALSIHDKLVPVVAAAREAARRTRPVGAPAPVWFGEPAMPDDIRAALVSAGFDASKFKEAKFQCEVELHDVRRWCTLAWMSIGAMPDQWTKNDEDRWDEAIDAFVETFSSGPWFRRENGVNYITFRAVAVYAEK